MPKIPVKPLKTKSFLTYLLRNRIVCQRPRAKATIRKCFIAKTFPAVAFSRFQNCCASLFPFPHLLPLGLFLSTWRHRTPSHTWELAHGSLALLELFRLGARGSCLLALGRLRLPFTIHGVDFAPRMWQLCRVNCCCIAFVAGSDFEQIASDGMAKGGCTLLSRKHIYYIGWGNGLRGCNSRWSLALTQLVQDKQHKLTSVALVSLHWRLSTGHE